MKNDWSARMNSAIEFIETNIDDELDISKIAKVASCSPFHFQRMFFAVIGISPSEYIRRRRLSLAANELLFGNDKVIDISIKYGYESPNAFTRAFTKMHGFRPSEVRNSKLKLSSFNRISFKIEIRGDENMEYSIVKKTKFKIIGKSKKFTHENFFKEAPKFWKNYVSSDEYKTLWEISKGKCGVVSEAPLMSIYIPDNVTSNDSFTDVFGIENVDNLENKIFSVFDVPSATYAEFQCSYQSSAKMNKLIYGDWLPSSGYERDPGKVDIAAYFPAAFLPMSSMIVRWWIPIIKKK